MSFQPSNSLGKDAWLRLRANRMAMLSLFVLIGIFFVSLFGPVLSSFSYEEQNLDKVFQTILKAATYELMYKPNLSLNIIIKEYLNSSNYFLENSQTKYLNALLDNVGKKLRTNA